VSAQPKAPKVYLAGPGVFRPEADRVAAHLKAECERLGLEGLWPADGPGGTARLIFRANIALIRSADALIADISPFRGPHSDDGTAFEMGFAFALGKPVFAWAPPQSDASRGQCSPDWPH
jgi:nucleoside 2-deoxyribosyltransferase